MKKKANVFGKKIPVFILVMVVALGVASAALLPYFGQITGSAVVSQGLVIDGDHAYEDGDIEATWNESSFTSLQKKTFVEKHSLDNNADVGTNVSLDTTCEDGTDLESTNEDSHCYNVKYKTVEYFDEAGHDFSDYIPSIDSGDSGVVTLTVNPDATDEVGSWDEAVSKVNTEDYDGIYVEDGTYTVTGQYTISSNGVTISAATQGGAILKQDGSGFSNTVDAEGADNLLIEGLRFESWIDRDGHNAISIKNTEGAIVRYNTFSDGLVNQNDEEEWTTLAALATNSNNVLFENNRFDLNDRVTAIGVATGQVYDGAYGDSAVSEARIRDKTE